MAGARPLSMAYVTSAKLHAPGSAAPADGGEAVCADGTESMPTDLDALEAAILQTIARARAERPDISVRDERFAASLGARVAPAELGEVRAGDLWLACACLDGDPAAIAIVDAEHLASVGPALAKLGVSADRITEVKQSLRKLVFVGDGTEKSPPRLSEYRGIGDLRAWLRVAAMRASIKLARGDDRIARDSDDALLEARAEAADPELQYMKAAYRSVFREAFQEALDSLLPRERTLLRQQIVDGLSIDDLGALYQVHRATAARWVSAAREKLLTRTRRVFALRARLTNDECESVMRLVRSQLDVSLRRRLGNA